MIWVVLGLVAALIIAVLAIALHNRTRLPDFDAIELAGPQDLPCAEADIQVMTWNIGYAALGKDADFVADSGTSLRALSKPEIAHAAGQIAGVLSEHSADIYCLQENAEPDFLTRGVDVRSMLDHALAPYHSAFWADLKSAFLPRRFRFCHGMSTYAAKQSVTCRIIPLPAGETLFFGALKKHYVGLLTKYPITGTDRAWVIINLHVPVFKTTQAARAAQVARLLEVAQAEYAQGNHVILGGDWNMRLIEKEFPHQTDMDKLYWLQDLPTGGLPPNWQINVDPSTPTVRSMHEAYVEGKTFTSIIDGFITSPNVHCRSIKTRNLGFQDTDHHPVEAHFSATPEYPN